MELREMGRRKMLPTDASPAQGGGSGIGGIHFATGAHRSPVPSSDASKV